MRKKRRSLAILLPCILAEAAAGKHGLGSKVPVAVYDGNSRVTGCNQPASDRGVRPGMRVSQVRTLIATLGLLPETPEAGAVLRGLGVDLSSVSPDVSLRPPDTIYIDLTSVMGIRSEAQLLDGVKKHLEELNWSWRMGVADQLGTARIAAQLSQERAVLTVPPGRDGPFLREIPVSRLGLRAESLQYLQLLGIRTLGELLRVRRASWERRLPDGGLLHALASGREETRLIRVVPRVSLREELVFEPPILHTEPILYRTGEVLQRLSMELLKQGRQMGLLRVSLFDEAVALLWETAIRPARRTRDARLLGELLALRLENVSLERPVGFCMIVAGDLGRERLLTEDLFQSNSKQDEVWLNLLERLDAAAGSPSLFQASLHLHSLPERSFSWRPAGGRLQKQDGGEDESDWFSMGERGLPPVLPMELSALFSCRPGLLLKQPLELRFDGNGGLQWRGRRRAVRASEPLDEVDTDWWREEPVSRRYRRLSLDCGARLFVFEEQGRWMLQGVFEC